VKVSVVKGTPRYQRPKRKTAHRGQNPWHLDLGAEVRAEGVRFRVWAPKCQRVEVAIEGERSPLFLLCPEEDGYFSGMVPHLQAGALYRYRLDGDQYYPDPCSRFQPEGPHGPSMVVAPQAYQWHDPDWPGVRMPGQVIYELHVGTFTPEGTFDTAARELAELKRLGITLIEIMPVAEFPGRWNWGYDGVDLYAPSHTYGDPEAFKRFIDTAHTLGLGVILDVVYNHLGPAGNYLTAYSDNYFTDRYRNDWGAAINFDGPGSSAVREFFIGNACYWIAEFHLDGLRLDATQDIHDASPVHVLAEISQCARQAAGSRGIVLIAENEPQQVVCITPVEHSGYGLDGMWNDDFHHTARVVLTGRREAYYTDYRGEPQEFLSAIRRGFLYQGQRYHWQEKPRGSLVTTQPASTFVIFTQNHDQVANSLRGERITALTSPACYRALTALMLLAPETPMLFMGQEFGASSPFLYFADHSEMGLARSVYEGRKEFLAQFPSYGSAEAQAAVPDPYAPATFERSKLDLSERIAHVSLYLFHQDLLRIRREDFLIARQDRERLDGAVLGPRALVLRFFADAGDDRLLVVNLGADFEYIPAPEPLLAPVNRGSWRVLWSSDDPRYGGPGIINPCGKEGWRLPGASAVLCAADRP
jgi:maltooligosyltrehalose trehalohydrolase